VEHLLDFCITKVYEAKKGDGSLVESKGDYGFWKLYTFHTDKTGDKKFSFMWDEKKPLPEQGLQIKHMEYEVKVEGKYTNYNAKKLELLEKSTPQAIPNAKEDMGSIPKSNSEPTVNRNASFYVAYASQMWCAMVSRLPEEVVSEMKLSEESDLVTRIGLDMMTIATGNTPSEAQTAPPGESEPNQEPDLEPDTKATATVKVIDPDGIPKVVCDNKKADFKGKEILTMYCKTQCKLSNSCATAQQLREAE